MKAKLALLASGTGTNVRNIIAHFENNDAITVDCVITNKSDAGALNFALEKDIDAFVFSKAEFNDGSVLELLKERGVTHVILAGFLLMISPALVDHFKDRILNIHPALLPNYGGKGMYGMNVHNAVYENKESKSGITIHLVNEEYDKGKILAQFEVDIEGCSPEEISSRVRDLEQQYFPGVIEDYITAN
ncbi:phosphoribosylglycinamide formyltransferase [Parvicella tangerina]|uniref:phosphoribosylglycinamide formyltransferase 1 n=1 Tax=Parvicella tangerina TaxID=2829795 RepID=A0A916NPW6_9FLAO|nr:phosphoribosylglycinamide formyltransferase [Parvicella tangerina]CAG5077646.1 Phosphoribosylglycinamide formyltransferase [Parvicella tangerina]